MNHEELTKYLAFMRKQRADSMKELKLTLKEVAERRVVDDTYNSDDVRDILHDATVNCEATFQSEVMLHSHMNTLLIRQYIEQAAQSNVTLKGDIRELENRERLAEVARLEESLFSKGGNNVKLETISAQTTQLPTPLEVKLKSRVDELEAALLNLKLSAAAQKIHKAAEEMEGQNVSRLNQRIKALEKELEDRIDKSVPVQNLKKMILQKNEILKDYRARLTRLDPTFSES
ncbi:leucine zipper-domain-containing protein [Chytriomyces sp. MP71]|nr:leucine zipper-domain-containing protein [Chytriomyces sp. MP71]